GGGAVAGASCRETLDFAPILTWFAGHFLRCAGQIFRNGQFFQFLHLGPNSAAGPRPSTRYSVGSGLAPIYRRLVQVGMRTVRGQMPAASATASTPAATTVPPAVSLRARSNGPRAL